MKAEGFALALTAVEIDVRTQKGTVSQVRGTRRVSDTEHLLLIFQHGHRDSHTKLSFPIGPTCCMILKFGYAIGTPNLHTSLYHGVI